MPTANEPDKPAASIPEVDAAGDLSPPAPRVHLAYLDGLRALAAIYVVLAHMYTQRPLTGSSPLGMLLVSPLQFGHAAVDVFIVLSGFCLMLPVARGDGALHGGAIRFYWKRARRILPPYYLTIAASLLLIYLWIGHKTGTHWDGSVPVTIPGLARHLLLLQDLRHDAQINHVLWSVAVEWRIYFLFPLLVILFRKWSPVKTAVAAVLLSYAVWFVLSWSPWHRVIDTGMTGLSPYYVGLFTLGMLAAHLSFSPDRMLRRWRSSRGWACVTLVGTVVVCVLSVLPVANGVPLSVQLMSFFFGLWSAALLVWMSVNPRCWPHRLCAWRPLAFLGAFSYSIYLMHGPLIQLIWQYAIHPLHLSRFTEFLLMVFPSLPIIVALCYLFFLACERPFLSKRGETMAQTERDAALSPAP
ncbi:MAG: acyltransferase [Capsulimonas sp.]|uniref:acyltransferase family protein n=1 Tax=Capsulimonas sp. TaxID=2494211 RepID=UPI0032675A51